MLMGQPTRQGQSPSVVARARNHSPANRALGFRFEVTAQAVLTAPRVAGVRVWQLT